MKVQCSAGCVGAVGFESRGLLDLAGKNGLPHSFFFLSLESHLPLGAHLFPLRWPRSSPVRILAGGPRRRSPVKPPVFVLDLMLAGNPRSLPYPWPPALVLGLVLAGNPRSPLYPWPPAFILGLVLGVASLAAHAYRPWQLRCRS